MSLSPRVSIFRLKNFRGFPQLQSKVLCFLIYMSHKTPRNLVPAHLFPVQDTNLPDLHCLIEKPNVNLAYGHSKGAKGEPRLPDGLTYCSTDSSGKVKAAKLPRVLQSHQSQGDKERTSQREAKISTGLLTTPLPEFCVQGHSLSHPLAATLVDFLRWMKCHLSLFHFAIYMLLSLYLLYYIEIIHLIKEAGMGVKDESKVYSSRN